MKSLWLAGLALLTAAVVLAFVGVTLGPAAQSGLLWDPRSPVLLIAAGLGGVAAVWARGRGGGRYRNGVFLRIISVLGCLTIILGTATYWSCYPDRLAFWAPLTEGLALFTGSYDDPFGNGAASCPATHPVAFQMARVGAFLTIFAGVLALFGGYLKNVSDKFGAYRNMRHIIVSGTSSTNTSADPLDLVGAIGSQSSVKSSLILFGTGHSELEVSQLRHKGVKIVDQLFSLSEKQGRVSSRVANNSSAIFLLGAEADINIGLFDKFIAVREASSATTKGHLLHAIVRIDDHWRGDEYRRNSLNVSKNCFVDVISVYSATARLLADRLSHENVSEITIVGQSPLVQALLNEFIIRDRESAGTRRADTYSITTIRVVGPQAQELIGDYELFQRRFGSWNCRHTVQALAHPASVADLAPMLGASDQAAVIYTDEVFGDWSQVPQQLAVRYPKNLQFLFNASIYGVSTRPMLGSLYGFGYSLALEDGLTAGIWGRMARQKHQRFLENEDVPEDTKIAARMPWDKGLSQFYKLGNVRPILNLLESTTELQMNWLPNQAVEDVGQQRARISQYEVLQLAKSEHDSWSRYHFSAGWTHGERNDTDKKHPDLVSWDELAEGGVRKNIGSVFGTMELLALMGFHPYRNKEATQGRNGWSRFVRTGEVDAEQLLDAHEWTTDNGDLLHGEAGDWLVSQGGSSWTVKPDIFAKSYKRLDDTGNRWQRIGAIFARQAVEEEELDTLEGPAHGEEGDMILYGLNGETWAVPVEKFRGSYQEDS